MPADDEPPKNPFVRWKQQVDAHVGLTLNGLLGIPTMVSKTLSLRQPEAQATANAGSAASQDGRTRGRPDADERWPSDRSSRRPNEGEERLIEDMDAAQLLEWHKFVHYSPYSPLSLVELPQPVPRDGPPGVDARCFTFKDAFDDLLEASSGRPMTDLKVRQERNVQNWLLGDEEYPWAWFHRLHSSRLVDAYFPRSSERKTEARGQSVGELAEDVQKTDWKQDAVKAYRQPSEQHSTEASSTRTGQPGNLFDEMDRILGVLTRIIEDETGNVGSKQQAGRGRRERSSHDEPETEDELYSAIRSAYADAEKSLSTFIKSIADVKFGGEASSSVSRSREARSDAASPGQGQEERTETETEEHVDFLGNRHVKTVIRKLDADGEEMGRETCYSIRGGSRSQGGKNERADEPGDAQPREEQSPSRNEDAEKRPGWFWK